MPQSCHPGSGRHGTVAGGHEAEIRHPVKSALVTPRRGPTLAPARPSPHLGQDDCTLPPRGAELRTNPSAPPTTWGPSGRGAPSPSESRVLSHLGGLLPERSVGEPSLGVKARPHHSADVSQALGRGDGGSCLVAARRLLQRPVCLQTPRRTPSLGLKPEVSPPAALPQAPFVW